MRGQCRFPGSAIAVPQSVTPTPNGYGRGPPSSAPRGSPREGRRSGQPSHRNTWQLLLPHEQVDGRKRYAGMQVKHFTPHAHTYVHFCAPDRIHRNAGSPCFIGVEHTLQAPSTSSQAPSASQETKGRWRRDWRRWKAHKAGGRPRARPDG